MEIDEDASRRRRPTVSMNSNATPDHDNEMTVNDDDQISQPIEGAENTEMEKSKTSRKRTSVVWNFFEKCSDESGEPRAICNFCGTSYCADPKNHGTSSLKQHLKKCKKNPENQSKCKDKELAFGDVEVDELTGEKRAKLYAWKFDQGVVRKALSAMIVMDELPFRFVEGEGFHRFVRAACPGFSVPCRKTVTKDVYSYFVEEKEKLKHVMKSTTSRICFTTDTWTSIQRINYMCLTAHFIDNQWKLQKRVLNFCPITSHKGDDIGEAVVKCWQDWGISKVFTITVDNASANDSALSYLTRKIASWNSSILHGRWAHMRCMAHILHLIVKQGLDRYSGGIDCVRAAVKFVRCSPSRLKNFKEVCSFEGVEYKKDLCLDVATRWNSTYLMLSVVLEYVSVFDSICTTNKDINQALKEPNGPGIPTATTWAEAKCLVKFLEEFYDITNRISGSKYVTANLFLEYMFEIDVVLRHWTFNGSIEMRRMAHSMKEKFDKYWDWEGEKELNKIIFIAAVLDPQQKMSVVSLMLRKMYGEVKSIEISVEVRYMLKEMFDDYNRLYAPTNDATSNTRTSSCNTSQTQSEDVATSSRNFSRFRAKLRDEIASLDVVEKRHDQSELDKYLDEGREPTTDGEFDILCWWKVNSVRFPILSHMARDVFAVPISTVASESTFSTGGRVLDRFRSSLTPKIVQALVCTQDWLRSSNEPINIEESIEELYRFEEELASNGDTNVIDRL